MRTEGVYKTIKEFLFSNMNKQFLVFLFFLTLSAVFWLIMTLNESYEKEIKVPVHITNIPKNVVLTSAETDTIRLTIRDKGWVLMTYLYGEQRPALNLNFKTYDHGNGGGIVASADIKRMAEQRLESSSKITVVKPDKLEFFYNNGECKRVPVHWTGRVTPEQLYFISHVDYQPDSVDVYAAKEKLDSIGVIYTEALNYTDFHDTLTVTSRLAHSSGIKVVPDRVLINFYTDVLTEEDILVPVRCVNLPQGKTLRTFPAKVSVHYVAGASQIRLLRPEDFIVVADYKEIQQKPSEKCNLYLRTIPQGINRATLTTKQVDYLIEEE